MELGKFAPSFRIQKKTSRFHNSPSFHQVFTKFFTRFFTRFLSPGFHQVFWFHTGFFPYYLAQLPKKGFTIYPRNPKPFFQNRIHGGSGNTPLSNLSEKAWKGHEKNARTWKQREKRENGNSFFQDFFDCCFTAIWDFFRPSHSSAFFRVFHGEDKVFGKGCQRQCTQCEPAVCFGQTIPYAEGCCINRGTCCSRGNL